MPVRYESLPQPVRETIEILLATETFPGPVFFNFPANPAQQLASLELVRIGGSRPAIALRNRELGQRVLTDLVYEVVTVVGNKYYINHNGDLIFQLS